MSTYAKTREAALTLRDALRPRRRAPKGVAATAFSEDRRRIRLLLSDTNILGFGVAEKVVQNKAINGEFSVTFYVRRKLATTRLRHEFGIPRRLRVHSLASVVLTDIHPLGFMHVAHSAINSGASIGHISGTAGTLTFGAQDVNTQDHLILSCSHVLARGGNAQPGDAIESPANASSSPQIVAYLTNRFMVIDPQVYNTIDAALAKPVDGTNLSNSIPGLGKIAGILDLSQTSDQSAVNLSLAKFGAATGLQHGHITGMHATLQIRFPELGDRVVWFTDLLTHNIPSQEGDSGAAILETAGMRVVGMHTAATGSSGLCTHIQPVLDTLQIELALAP